MSVGPSSNTNEWVIGPDAMMFSKASCFDMAHIVY